MKKILVAAGVALGMAGGATGAVSYYASSSHEIKLGMAEDHLPNTTAQDWVTYADHVLVVTPTSDQAIEPDESDSTNAGLINRDMTLRVDEVVWSNPTAQQAAPNSLSWTAWGWTYSDGDLSDRTEFGVEGSARLETGHSYIVAVSYEQARCAKGDARESARWAPLGSGAIVPYDNSTVGLGEFEGSEQSLTEARSEAAADSDFPTLGQQLVGKTTSDLAEVLAQTSPTQKKTFTLPAPC